jgi:predicted unusual protein kinase regulating ubiquinone biosynthesis (AarF/ABC1/UbiB family)
VAAEVLTRAARRSVEEARDTFGAAGGAPNVTSLARFGDLVRAQTLLWTAANLSAVERLERAASAGGGAPPGFPPGFSELAASAPSPRVFVLGVVAMDLWVGYAALRARARLMPGLVLEEDWELQDRVPPQPWTVIEGAVAREIGCPIREAFKEFDSEPVASASIAQVHRARLADGRQGAVKIQYPGIAQVMEADLAALEGIFGAISRLEPTINLQPILDYLRWTLPMELDFRREARAIADLKEAMSHRDDVLIPEVREEMNTERLLVMEFVEGIKVTDREGLLAAGVDPRRVAELLIEVYAEQLFQRGVFHADPHPGNLFVQPGRNGPVLVLLDHGLTVSVPPELVAAMKEAIEALSEGDFDALTDALGKAGLELDPNLDLDTLLGLVGVLLGGDRGGESEGGGTDLGEFGLSLGASIGHIPNDLLLVGRAIGLIDGITRQLDPDLDTISIVARYAQDT